MDYNAFFGSTEANSQEAPSSAGGTSLAETWKTEAQPEQTSTALDTFKKAYWAPAQVAGGLAQGIANFVIGGTVATVGAEAASGASVINPLAMSNIQRLGLNAKKFFLPFLFDEEDQRALNQNNQQWNQSADEWVKNYHAISESVSEHPFFKPQTIDNALGDGYKGSENVQGMLGAVTTWIADQGKSASEALMKAGVDNPQMVENLKRIGATPQNVVEVATAVETAINGIPLLAPYFGKDAYHGIRDRLGNLKKANETGDVANTMTGRYNRPENANPGSVVRNFFIEPTGKYVKPDIPFENIKPGQLGYDSSRPGPMPSTDQPTTFMNKAGQLEEVLGEMGFLNKYMREHEGVTLDTAKSAWNEYANEVTLQAYPDAYIAYEMKASGFDALQRAEALKGNPNVTGRQQYLNHVFDARNTDNIYGYRNTMTIDGQDFHLKDYITFTPSEFGDATGLKGSKVPYGSGGPEAPRGPQWRPNINAPHKMSYVDYINQKSSGYGLEPVDDFNNAVKRSFELRDMEFESLKAAQEELAWKERYFQNELDPLVEKLKTQVSEFNGEGSTPTNPRDFRASKEGPDYTSEQVQSYFDSNAKSDIVEAHLNDILERQTRNLKDPIDAPSRGPMGRQRGIARPDVFGEGIAKMTEPVSQAIEKAGNVKDTVDAITGIAAPAALEGGKERGALFSRKSRTLLFGKNELLGEKGSFLDSQVGEIIGVTNAQEWLRKVQDKSPTLRKILDSFDRPFEGMGKAVITPFEETRKLRVAEFDQAVKGAFAPLRPSQWGSYGGLHKLQNEQLNSVLRGTLPIEKAAPAIQETVRRLRSVLDNHYQKMVNAKVKGLSDRINYLENYFHRSYDMDGKFHLEDKWMSVMRKYGIDENVGQEIFDNLTTHDKMYRVNPENIDSFMQDNTLAHKKSSVDYERMLRKVPDSELEPFLNKNVYQTLTKYNEEWAHRLTFAERYGANMEVLRNDIGQIANEFEARGEAFPKYAAQHIYGLVQALDHNYKEIQNRTLRQIQKGTLSLVNISLLPLVTLASAAEVIMPIGVTGMKDFAKSVPSTLGIAATKVARRIVKDIPKGIREQIFEDTGAAFESANHMAVSGLAGGAITAVDQAFFKLNGLHHLTKFNKLNAVNAFISHAESVMKAAKDPKTMGDWLKKGGFNAAKAKRLTEFMEYYGLDLDKGKDWVAKGMPKEHEFYPQMVRGALRFSEDAVLMPNPATLPLWYSNPHFALVKHLKTFTSLMFTRVMKRAARNMARNNAYYNLLYGPKVLATATGMLATGILINQVMDQINYGNNPTPFKKTPKGEILRGFERVGFFGPLSIVYDTLVTSKLGIGSTLPGPTGSLLLEGSIDVNQWLKHGDYKTLSRFIAKHASIFGKISQSRNAIEKAVGDILQTVKPPKEGKDWRF